MNYTQLLYLHWVCAIIFVVSYAIKSSLFLLGKKEAYLIYKKKTFVIETIFSVLFLIFGIWMLVFRIKSQTYTPDLHKWLDAKMTLALAGIPLGIIGLKKENKIMVALSLLFFIVAAALGLSNLHY